MHHHSGGLFWGGGPWGGGWGGPYMRRRGFPLMGGFGGFGGYGMGGGLLGDLFSGGIGYMLGRSSAQQQVPQYQQPQYAPQYQPPQYQAPQYQPPYQQAPAAQPANEQLAQLRLLGHLREQGVLTDDEFEAEKQRILHG
jgi:hypothetical protein